MLSNLSTPTSPLSQMSTPFASTTRNQLITYSSIVNSLGGFGGKFFSWSTSTVLSQAGCLISSPPGNRSCRVILRESYECFVYMPLSRSFGRRGTVVFFIKFQRILLNLGVFSVLFCYCFESVHCNFRVILLCRDNVP